MMEFKMPSLGADMEDGVLVEWRKKPGDHLNRGDIIADVETQKGLIEIEVFEEGRLDSLLCKPGEKIEVGRVIALIDNGKFSFDSGKPAGGEVETVPPVTGSVPAPVPVAAPAPVRRKISPLARQLAAGAGLDPEAIPGTGEGGAVTREDVETAIAARAAGPAVSPPAADPIRMAIAAAMSRSARDIPAYYLQSRIDMHQPLGWLARTNAGLKPADRLLPAVMYIRAAALALQKCPELNAEWKDGLILKKDIHIGFVVSLRQGGILVPAIHHADRKSPAELMAALSDVIKRVRAGKLRSSDLSDSTFTLTCPGEGGADALFGIIYPPQTALLGIGRVSDQVIAENGTPVVRPCITATLAADHRASDGLSGGRFLTLFEEYLQNPPLP